MSFITQPLTSILLKPKRMIGTIEVQVVLNESTTDAIEITQQPVQQGASIADHAFRKPVTLSMQLLFSATPSANIQSIKNIATNTGLSDIYQSLLNLQRSFVPFDIVTPKRKYSNMMFTAIGMTTDKKTENTLAITASFQEVIIAKIGVAVVPISKQANAKRTAGIQNLGNKSAAFQINEGLNAAIQGVK